MKKIFTLLCLVIAITAQAQPGNIDSSFGNNGKVVSRFSNQFGLKKIALQNDGKIVGAGSITASSKLLNAIICYNANGSVDKSFGDDGKVVLAVGDSTGNVTGLTLQQDGKILVTGDAHLGGVRNQLFILRYTKNGIIDSSFGTNGLAYLKDPDGNFGGQAIHVQTDGKIVINGFFADRVANIDYIVVARFLSNGKKDTSFNSTGKNYMSFGLYSYPGNFVIQNDGKITGTGNGSIKHSTVLQSLALYRLNKNGRLDNSFGKGGKVIATTTNNSQGFDLKVSSDGKIVAAGITFVQNELDADQLIMRFKTNGDIDSSFGNNGTLINDFVSIDKISAISIQTNGKIVVAGTGPGSSFASLTRYFGNGKPDNSFGTNGAVSITFNNYPNNYIDDMLIQPDGKILTANSTGNVNNSYGALARYIGDATMSFVNHQRISSSLLSSIKVYANPVKYVLYIEHLPSTKTVLSITNNYGNIFKTTISTSSNFQWKVDDLKPGEYYVSIQNSDEKKSILFMKQ